MLKKMERIGSFVVEYHEEENMNGDYVNSIQLYESWNEPVRIKFYNRNDVATVINLLTKFKEEIGE